MQHLRRAGSSTDSLAIARMYSSCTLDAGQKGDHAFVIPSLRIPAQHLPCASDCWASTNRPAKLVGGLIAGTLSAQNLLDVSPKSSTARRSMKVVHHAVPRQRPQRATEHQTVQPFTCPDILPVLCIKLSMRSPRLGVRDKPPCSSKPFNWHESLVIRHLVAAKPRRALCGELLSSGAALYSWSPARRGIDGRAPRRPRVLPYSLANAK